MAKMELISNNVEFLEDPHEYWLTLPDGEKKQLFGITSAIQHQIAKDEYANCPDYMIKKAGEYGKSIHKSIEKLVNDFEHDGSVEVEDFRNLTEGMEIAAVEYNVSDLEYWSSNVDVVVRESDTEFTLIDIKSYGNAKLTKHQLLKAKFQLSIYAMLMENQLKGCRIKSLKILRLCNKVKKDGSVNHIAEFVQVDRIPADICQRLLDAERYGTTFANPFDIPQEVASKVNRIIKLIHAKKEAEDELNQIKKDVLETMLFLDVKNWKDEKISFSRTDETSRNSFDLAKFRKDFPDLPYDDYIKTSKVAGSLKIAI